MPRHGARFLGESRVLIALRASVERGQRSIVPGDAEHLTALLGGPEAVGHHGDAAIDLNNVPHARHGPCAGVIDRFHLATEDRRAGDDGDQHARQRDIQTKDRRAVDLRWRVKPLRRLAD